MKQKEIAKKIKVSQQMISLVMSGDRRMSWKAAKRAAKFFGVTPDLFMDGTADQIREIFKKKGGANDSA